MRLPDAPWRRQRCCSGLNAIARLRSFGPLAALFLIVMAAARLVVG